MAGLIAELWIDYLIGDVDEFFSNDEFLADGVDLSYAVENDRINFSYKGPRPGIVKNFRTDGNSELPVYMRTDIPEFVDLDNFSTEQFVLPRVDLFGLPYDKKTSLMQDCRDALIADIAADGMWNVGPQANTAKTPVIAVNAANDDAGDGYDAITRADIVKLRVALDKKYPGKKNKNWKLVVDTDSYWWLVDNDDVLKGQYQQSAPLGIIMSRLNGGTMGDRVPVPLSIANFTLVCDDRTAWYAAADSTKIDYNDGSPAFTDGTDFKSALAYVVNDTYCKALGTTEVFSQDRHPGKQADLASYLTRAYVGPWGVTAANFKLAGAILRRPHS